MEVYIVRYAVCYMNFFDNDLQIRIVDNVTTWKEALEKVFPENKNMDLPHDMGDAKEYAFDGDWLFDVVEIPNL